MALPASVKTASDPAAPPRRLTIFSLPPELRQAIYTHALTPAPTDAIAHLTARDIHVHLALPRRAQASLRSANYWTSRALQRRLRLLRVHSAVHAEASAVLYGRFAFSFPPWDDGVYFRALAGWLGRPVAGRAKIREVRVWRAVAMAVEAGGAVERRWERGAAVRVPEVFEGPEDLRIVGRHLRALRRVVVHVRFGGFDVLERDREWVVQRVLALARPFHFVPDVQLIDYAEPHSQQRAIADEARRRMRETDGWWRLSKQVLAAVSRAQPGCVAAKS